MLRKLHIENFKSIYDLDIELGRVNVLIGENGCGKSNILEALALASAVKDNRLKNDDFAQKGIRVTRPDMMMNSFFGIKPRESIRVECLFSSEKESIKVSLSTNNPSNIYSLWVANEEQKMFSSIPSFFHLKHYLIYEVQTNPLRGFNKQSYEIPGRNGENLDILLERFDEAEWEQLLSHSNFISWLDGEGVLIDKSGDLNRKRLKLRSDSKLYFKDKFMQKKNNVFSVENANEGALHILFYLALFISKRTPKFFAIDHIENALNPYLCRVSMKNICELAKENDKQTIITTHNPAVLDGLDLHDDEQRLFVVFRNEKGHTTVKRVELGPNVEVGGNKLNLSELWMRNHFGGIPENF